MKKTTIFIVILSCSLSFALGQIESNSRINSTTPSDYIEDEATTTVASSVVEAKTVKNKGKDGLVNRQSSLLLGPAVQGLMSTATGVLAAVGGGYLMYALMVTMFENVVDPAFNRAHGHTFSVPPPGPGQPPAQPGPFRRTGIQLGLPAGLDRIVNAIRSDDYPEATFKYLKVESFNCRKRAVCELEQLLSRAGMPKSILQSISTKIPGMRKYEDAIWWALQKNTCKALQTSCPHGLGQTLLKAIGLS